MKYLPQALLVFLFTCLGELLHYLIPVPIPASIYGMILLFLALFTGIVPLKAVKEAGSFLTSILPVLFVVATVGLIDHWELLRSALLPIALILILTTLLTFAISGWIAQWITDRKEKRHE